MTPQTLYTIGEPLARKIKIPRQTLDSAVKRGAIASHLLGCGMTVVDITDVQRWAVSWRKKPIKKPTEATTPKGKNRAKK
jgi:hypothetical protein